MGNVGTRQARCAGLWIDQAGATIVRLEDEADPKVSSMESGVESHYRQSGGRKSGTSTQDVSDDKRGDRKRRQHLDRYYEQVVAALGDAERLLILGPGEAKHGLERTLNERRDRKPLSITVEAADKMTEPQVVAAVKRFFSGKQE